MNSIAQSLSLVVAAAASAQTFDLDKTAPATLGSNLQLAVRNAPANALMFWMPSFTNGPTPLALIDPADSRSLSVGTDLTANWSTAATSPTGTAALAFALPPTPAFAGIRIYWQCMTFPGAVTLAGALSNDVLVQTGAANASALLPGALAFGRGMAALAPMGTNSTEVLVTGGGGGSLTGSGGLASTEIWDMRRLVARPGPTMVSGRALHLAVTLNDGRTLLIGGTDATGAITGTCEIYNPATNSFTATGSLLTGRALHAAAKLPDGRVMVAGGTSSLVDTTSAITSTLNSVEIYNPSTGLWTAGPALGGRRLAPALTTLSTGRVMVSGGVEVGFFLGIPLSASSTTAVQLYNPATNTWSAGAAMPAGRAGHQYNQVTLADNRVLLSGGIAVTSLTSAATDGPTARADVYNPTTNTWVTSTMAAARYVHSATRLLDGRVVVCGGSQGSLTADVTIADVEVFSPATNTWASLAPLAIPRTAHLGLVQTDGLLVLISGDDALTLTPTVAALHF